MTQTMNPPDLGESNLLRLNTLIRLRWLAIVGQSATVVIVAYGYGFSVPVGPCFALIACSAALNVYLALSYPATYRLKPTAAFGVLTFDALQLAGLLFMTGGLTNPFSLLMTVPVVVSATSLPLRMTALLGALVIAMATALASGASPAAVVPGVVAFHALDLCCRHVDRPDLVDRLHRHLCLSRRRGGAAACQCAGGNRTGAAARAAPVGARRAGGGGGARTRHAAGHHRPGGQGDGADARQRRRPMATTSSCCARRANAAAIS